MCRKLINLVSFVLVLGLVLTSVAGAADPDMIGWWPLNEGSGDVAIDLSGSGNDGTIRNADSGGLGAGGSVWVNDPERGMVISFNGDDGTGAVVSTDLIIPASTLDSDFTWAFWAKQHADQATNNDTILGNRNGGTQSPLQFIKFTPTRFEHYNDDGSYSEGINYNSIPLDVWVHHVISKDGPNLTYYRNGVESGTNTISKTIDENPFGFGGDAINNVELWRGYMSDVRLYTKALTQNEVLGAMEGTGEVWPYASSPTPRDGTLHADTWVNISWRPGGHAVSHDVYLGDNFNDVNDGAGDTFRGNQAETFFVAGFPGFPYPEGLVPGTTYYWRIDEVNDAEPNSPWKGDVWSFSIPPKTAYFPEPADAAELVDTGVQLKWTGGFGAKLHTIYFGDNFDDVSNAAGGLPQGTTTYPPGPLKTGKTYYWRVDEFDIIETYKGEVWSFTTEGAVVSLKPSNGAVDVKQTQILTWSPGEAAASHQVYFGTDKEVVRDADTGSPEYKGTRDLGSESYDPGMLEWDSTYYWRVDEVNTTNPDSPWIGPVWSFTTANFLIVDDFENYNDIDPPDPESNRIFEAWLDGYGIPTNGALVGNDLPPYAEQSIVHSGIQSMPYFYDNSVGYSEATLTLTYPRDWTEKGVDTLTIWFRGNLDNAAETLYVALNGTAVVNHDNPDAAQINEWTQWNIDLQAFGINLANVNTIALGLGNKNNPLAGGSGTIYFDDIRLYPPAPTPTSDTNLVGWWKLDEGSDTIAVDSSGHENNGSLNGTAMSWMPNDGMIGGALSFDGTASDADYVEISTADISLAAGTVAMWGKLGADPQLPATRYFCGHTTIPAWSSRIQLYMDNSDTILDLGLGDSHARQTDIMSLTTETWYHVALTWDGGNYVVYVNGEEKANGSYTGLDALNTVADIGNDGNTDGRTESFNGLLDDVRIYNVALTGAEISNLAGAN